MNRRIVSVIFSIIICCAFDAGAIEDFNHAIKNFNNDVPQAKNYAKPYIGLGQIYFDQNNYELALEQLEKAIEIKPDSRPALELLRKTRLKLQENIK